MNKNQEKPDTSTKMERRTTDAATRPTPFGFMRRFAEEMEDLFGEFGGVRFPKLFEGEFLPFGKDMVMADWSPKIEVKENKGKFTVRAELPGMTKDNVNVEVTDHLLTISGERKEEKEEKEEGYYRSEMNYGSFYRQIPLPEGAKTDKATANFSDGVLEISMDAAKAETKGPRKLEIGHGKSTAKSA